MTTDPSGSPQLLLEEDCDIRPGHPLEVIAFFQRWPRSVVRNIVYTVIFSSAIGVFLALMSLPSQHYRSLAYFFDALWDNLVISNVIGFTFHLMYNALGPLMRRLNRLPLKGQIACYSLLSMVVVQIGALAASFIPGYQEIRVWMTSVQWFTSSMVIAFIISLILSLAWQARYAGLIRAAEIARERQRAEAAERIAIEANLRVLQAQIEPHFLFNTLANVVSLIDPQPAKARQMLQDFIEYLRSSLAATRARSSTLGREGELMRSYLRLIKIRMGERLDFRVDIPEDLQEAPFPPMLLQPLIENAVKHGLESKIEGGELVVRAQRKGEFIELTVEDSGLGFQGDAQSGMGLSNVRERLAAIFGEAAKFTVESREPCGTTIRFLLPMASAGAP